MAKTEREYADEFLCDDSSDWHDIYYVSPMDGDLNSLEYRLSRAGIEVAVPTLFTVGRHRAPAYSILSFVTAGEGFLSCGDREYVLKAGQMFLLPPGIAHRYSSNPTNPFGLVWIEFYGGDSQRLLSHITNTHGYVLDGAIAKQTATKLTTMIQKVQLQPQACVSLEIYQVLLHLLQFKPQEKNDHQLHHAPMEKVLQFIDAHIYQKMTNEQLAQVCHMSKAHFIRQFQEHYHMTPQSYILDKKLQIAKYYLIYQSISMEKISEILGFSDASHFTRVFKAKEGTTPKRYRSDMSCFRA